MSFISNRDIAAGEEVTISCIKQSPVACTRHTTYIESLTIIDLTFV